LASTAARKLGWFGERSFRLSPLYRGNLLIFPIIYCSIFDLLIVFLSECMERAAHIGFADRERADAFYSPGFFEVLIGREEQKSIEPAIASHLVCRSAGPMNQTSDITTACTRPLRVYYSAKTSLTHARGG
jgi:hypothetical protein